MIGLKYRGCHKLNKQNTAGTCSSYQPLARTYRASMKNVKTTSEAAGEKLSTVATGQENWQVTPTGPNIVSSTTTAVCSTRYLLNILLPVKRNKSTLRRFFRASFPLNVYNTGVPQLVCVSFCELRRQSKIPRVHGRDSTFSAGLSKVRI